MMLQIWCPWHQWYTWRWPQDGRERPQPRSSGRRPSHHRWSPLALLHHSTRSWDVPTPELVTKVSGLNFGGFPVLIKGGGFLKTYLSLIEGVENTSEYRVFKGTYFFWGKHLQEWSGFHFEGHLCMLICSFQFHLNQSFPTSRFTESITEQQQKSNLHLLLSEREGVNIPQFLRCYCSLVPNIQRVSLHPSNRVSCHRAEPTSFFQGGKLWPFWLVNASTTAPM